MLTTQTRKFLMAATGLFLCFFLVIHLLGNLQLFLPADKARLQFNWYSNLLSENVLIKLISYLLYLSILLHVADAVWLSRINSKAVHAYKRDSRSRASKWYTRNMGVLGTVILIFLIIHFKNFWYVYKFGSLPVDEQGHRDLYALVVAVFQEWWYVVIYVLSMIALCYHLIHGTYSAVRTIGLYHPVYVRWMKWAGIVFSIVVCTGFALMPVYVFFTST